ncbi:hypothetical protein Bca52824_032542 [Brassica carinata]|uniref:Uncharacterized protein n=1 Tax=Brassica carinata TaxID=52824 RepID=A0A8X7V8R8_BRACI|nr:hypothetical protein Bca52824_032542 [Brassica carinata]
MDSNPVEMSTGYVDLLTSQHGFSYVPLSSSSQVPVFGTQGTEASSPPENDLISKERLAKIKILDKLLAKNEGLDEFEDGLKKKLIEELF